MSTQASAVTQTGGPWAFAPWITIAIFLLPVAAGLVGRLQRSFDVVALEVGESKQRNTDGGVHGGAGQGFERSRRPVTTGCRGQRSVHPGRKPACRPLVNLSAVAGAT